MRIVWLSTSQPFARFFTPIGDILLKQSEGTLAIVVPYTACTGTSGEHERDLLTDPERFEVETGGHKPRQPPNQLFRKTPTSMNLLSSRVVQLPKRSRIGKPRSYRLRRIRKAPARRIFLAEAIQTALKGDNSALAAYGTIAWRSIDQLRGRPWNAACFYDQSLAEVYDLLLENPALTPIGKLALVEPGGQRVRDAFKKAEKRQKPGHARALEAQV